MRQRIPFVFYDRVPANFPGAAVVTDNFEASRQAVRYLIGLGHERIAIVIPGAHLAAIVERLEGFRQALKEEHLAVREDYIRGAKIPDISPQSAYQYGLELLRLPDPPTAIFCANNRMTLGLMRALGELRITCPECVSLLGFDDFDWAASANPPVTTVAQPTYEIGKQAMQLLVRKMEGEKDELGLGGSHLIVLPSQLRIRKSTAPPPRVPSAKATLNVTPEPAVKHLKDLPEGRVL
jgi:LacI family transcriptional regulator